jgi:cytochrome P450
VVEELLRFVCPVQIAFPRIARREVQVGARTVRAGDVVVVSLTGAGRDPARHEDPARFDPTTASAATLAFGHGLHRCVGAELARMELRTALVALARRFPDLSLACDPRDLRFTELAIVHGVESLPVHLG